MTVTTTTLDPLSGGQKLATDVVGDKLARDFATAEATDAWPWPVYLERVESTARVLAVTENLVADCGLRPVQCWLPVVIVAGEQERFTERLGIGAAEQGEAEQGFSPGDGIIRAAQDRRGLKGGLDEALEFVVVKARPPARRGRAGAGEGPEAGTGLDGRGGGKGSGGHAGAGRNHEGSEHDARKAGRADQV